MIRQTNDLPLDHGDGHHDEVEQDVDSAASAHVSEAGNEHFDRQQNDDVVGSSKPAGAILTNSRKKKSAAWADPDDQNIQVSLASDKRLRKLRDGPQEDTIGGRDYEARLRRQYGFSFSRIAFHSLVFVC